MNIGVIGVGRLGICFALLLDRSGYQVIGSDIRPNYINDLQSRQINTNEPGVKQLLAVSNIEFTTDTAVVVQQSDVIYVMVATPSRLDGSYDISAINRVINDVEGCNADLSGKILVIGCTTNPGDCQEIQNRLRARGIHVLYNPEFIAQGSILNDLENADMVLIGGEDPAVIDWYAPIYNKIQPLKTPSIKTMALTSAEVVKISINCFLTTKISYANMIGETLSRSGHHNDIDAALDAIGSDTRVGSKYLKYGFGYGGPCLPRDNRAFAHYVQTLGLDFPIGTAVDRFNHQHTAFLEEYFVKANAGALPFYLVDIAYKPGTDIFEESQQLMLCKRLLALGHTVYVEQNPLIPTWLVTDLDQQFGQLIQFERKQDLLDRGVDFFEISA